MLVIDFENLKHTSRGSKLINLYVALHCLLAWHKFFKNLLSMLVCCMLVIELFDEMKN
jgi:hypothetical protein